MILTAIFTYSAVTIGLSCENDGSGANNNDLQISKKRSVDLMSYDEDEGYKGSYDFTCECSLSSL